MIFRLFFLTIPDYKNNAFYKIRIIIFLAKRQKSKILTLVLLMSIDANIKKK